MIRSVHETENMHMNIKFVTHRKPAVTPVWVIIQCLGTDALKLPSTVGQVGHVWKSEMDKHPTTESGQLSVLNQTTGLQKHGSFDKKKRTRDKKNATRCKEDNEMKIMLHDENNATRWKEQDEMKRKEHRDENCVRWKQCNKKKNATRQKQCNEMKRTQKTQDENNEKICNKTKTNFCG